MRRAAPSLVHVVQGLLERTYAMRTGVADVARFLIGDRGYRALYRPEEIETSVGARGEGARTLVRRARDGWRAAIYFPDEQIRRLEAFPPQRGLHAENVEAFATLVEEIDHLLVIAERAVGGRPVSLFELELHANVSKHLVLSRFLAGTRDRLSPRMRLWLRERLFTGADFCEEDPAVRQRYRDATRWALRLIDALPGIPPASRLGVLREFHSASAAAKLRLIGDLSA